jgi:AraC-like DNA-binding protein
LAYFREVVGRSLARVEFSPVEGHPLKWAVDVHSFDGLVVVSAENSAIRSHRAPSLLSDGNDDLIFVVSRTGYSLASQLGRDCRIGGPAVSVLSNAEPGTNDYPIPTRSLHLRIPRRRLAALVGTPEDAVTRPIPADCEPVRLLLDYVDMALRQDRLTTPQLQQLFTTHVQDLVALAIGAAGDPAEVAGGRGLAAARLNAAKADISRRLDEDRMAIADVAGRLGVTPRYLQMLFEAEGMTFTEYVVAQRLARAHRILSDPRFLHQSITTIAFDVGFGHLSYFNRLFRQKYGATPSEVRGAAVRAAEPA